MRNIDNQPHHEQRVDELRRNIKIAETNRVFFQFVKSNSFFQGFVMEATIKPSEDTFYILATDSTSDEVKRVLKDSETFAVFDRHGDIQAAGSGQEGLYHEGTRFLSRLVFKLGNARPFLLNSGVKEDNLLCVVNLTNPDVYQSGKLLLPRGTLHIARTKLLRQSMCYETLRFINYGLSPVEVYFSIEFGADFADLFEVRGVTRARRGVRSEGRSEVDRVWFAYEGLDGLVRQMRIQCDPAPKNLTPSAANFVQYLGPKEDKEFFLTYGCEVNGSVNTLNHRQAHTEAQGNGSVTSLSHTQAYTEAEAALKTLEAKDCQIRTSSEQFNEWLIRSASDLHMMFTATPFGFYPYAGVPWYSTPFGRDGIITALEYLWVNPEIARGVLGYLAALQAKQRDPARDAEPGKILHETRKGEMAALREIPFELYYGSIDATPLFVMLAGAYLECTHDLGFIKSIWPHIDFALRWIDHYGDRDGDGFLEYERRSPMGLIHQGWKDSWDSVFHRDGELAEGPIALCEVQGYAYAARLAGAVIASTLGQTKKARMLLTRAEVLKENFQKSFWCEELSNYALALDGDKRQCRVSASNAGHCLYTGIAGIEQASRIAATLMEEQFFSGWGVRTLAVSESRFNPMSYHNGSVWPHDNALIAAGLARYGFKDHATRILSGLFDASLCVEYRLPELFCGFYRRDGEGPVPYPVACSPQSWSAASVFSLLQSILGMKIQGAGSRLSFVRPVLPEFLDGVQISNLKVGSGSVDLLIQRRTRFATIEIERREGPVEVLTEA
jgi:glycogen debranching enzyme